MSFQSFILLLIGVTYAADIKVDSNNLPIFELEADLIENMKSIEAAAVVVLVHDNNDRECKKNVEQLEIAKVISEMVKFSEEELGVPDLIGAILNDKDYNKKHYIRGCPNLVLYRSYVPILYDGENLHMRLNREEIGQWISTNTQSDVKHLSTETFEHLTQASTGATTGDWLIWFHETRCSELTPVWEAVASRLKYSKVTGEVDVTLNPKLAQRFGLKDCQNILLFRQGKRYTYTGDIFHVHALAKFAEVSYKNFKSLVVTPPPSPFDEKLEEITKWLKRSEYGFWALMGVSSFLFVGILLLVCQESQQAADAQKKAN